jgi:CspA family cold shock protein
VPDAVVRWFDADRGFGFLALDDGGEDLFVHASEIAMSGGAKLLREGQSVEFEVGEGDRGLQALRVRVTGESAPDSVLGLLGTVVWYEPSKGYGFVEPDGGGSQIFVHSSAIVTRGVVCQGQRVAFLVGEGERGPQAEHLLPLASGVGGPAAGDGADGADGADGIVSWYDEGKGFGFVTPDCGGEDVFVHARALGEGLTSLSEGDRVAYGVVRGDKGPQAREVHLVGGGVGTGGFPSVPHGPAGRRGSGDGPVRGGEGVVARFDADRGFGFIAPDAGGADLFVHVSVVVGAAFLQQGERVRYAVRQSDRGPQADRVERL